MAVVLHTSGTTSRPKQVPLLQRNLMASVRTIAAHYRLGPADVSFCVMPLFHIHGLVASAFAALSAGGTVIAPRRFTAHRFWPQAREHGATWLSAGPTLHQMILDRADDAGPPADAAVRPLLQLGAVGGPAGAGRGQLPGADAGGLRDDRGQPPDDLQSAAPGARGYLARSACPPAPRSP